MIVLSSPHAHIMAPVPPPALGVFPEGELPAFIDGINGLFEMGKGPVTDIFGFISLVSFFGSQGIELRHLPGGHKSWDREEDPFPFCQQMCLLNKSVY